MSENSIFTPMEIDGIGEILNISLGSSATAMSDMLGKKVTITTPNVNVLEYEEFRLNAEEETGVGVEITYVEGLAGKKLLLLKREDVRKILELLMFTEIDPAEFQLDELSLSAVCELMNQMMGASATALADIIGESVNISTPIAFEIENQEDFKEKYFSEKLPIVEVFFNIEIEDTFKSTFVTMLSIELCQKLIENFGFSDEEIEEGIVAASEAKKLEEELEIKMPDMVMEDEVVETKRENVVESKTVQASPQIQQTSPQAQEPRMIDTKPILQGYDVVAPETGTNLDLIMKVPLQISVEIGRTKKLVKEILEFGQGSLIVLDKLAGDQVDIYVNGQCIAKGDVVVLDDNFGVKITEVMTREEIINSL